MTRSAAAVTGLIMASACTGLNTKTATFATLAEAAPAIAQGWIPKGLPSGAYELRAAYVPGGWQRWGIINFPPAAGDELRGLLQPQELSLAGMRCDVPGRIEWWPVQLRHQLDSERITATGAKAYRARDPNLIFVVNWTQGRAYYWTTG